MKRYLNHFNSFILLLKLCCERHRHSSKPAPSNCILEFDTTIKKLINYSISLSKYMFWVLDTPMQQHVRGDLFMLLLWLHLDDTPVSHHALNPKIHIQLCITKDASGLSEVPSNTCSQYSNISSCTFSHVFIIYINHVRMFLMPGVNLTCHECTTLLMLMIDSKLFITLYLMFLIKGASSGWYLSKIKSILIPLSLYPKTLSKPLWYKIWFFVKSKR